MNKNKLVKKIKKARNVVEDALAKVPFDEMKDEYYNEVYEALNYLEEEGLKYADLCD